MRSKFLAGYSLSLGRMGKMHIRKKIAWLILSCVFLCLYNPPLFAEDQQNCLFCHKYQRLRAYDAQGTLHNFMLIHGFSINQYTGPPPVSVAIVISKQFHMLKLKKLTALKSAILIGGRPLPEQLNFRTRGSQTAFRKVFMLLNRMIHQK